MPEPPANIIPFITFSFFDYREYNASKQYRLLPDVTAVAGIIECLPKLEVFRWSATRTNEEGSLALCKALANCPNMKELIICDNYFGEELGEVAASTIANMKGLKTLILSDLSMI